MTVLSMIGSPISAAARWFARHGDGERREVDVTHRRGRWPGRWLAANYCTSAQSTAHAARFARPRVGDAVRGVFRSVYRRTAERGQALVETALVLPVLLLLAFGVLGAARVTQAQMGVSAVSREAARVGALAGSPSEAAVWGTARGREVAAGYGLANGSLQLTVDPGAMARGGQVQAVARYELSFDDLPLLSWVRVPVRSSHAELIDPYRSR